MSTVTYSDSAADGTGSYTAESAMATSPSARTARWAAWTFGVYVAAAFPLILFGLGRYWWFFRDDWYFVAERDISVDGLMQDHNGHWSTVPVAAFRLAYVVFGIRSYMPYQAMVVVAHLAVAVCIRMIMRRYDVNPWLATVAAGALVLFGSGREDIIWAFQIGFTGSLAFTLAQWVIADRPGPVRRSDYLAPVLGTLGLASSSPALMVMAGLSVTLLVRRGWKPMVINVGPPALAYLVWSALIHPDRSSPWGRPGLGEYQDWVTTGVRGVFVELTGFWWAGAILGLAVAVGIAMAVLRPGTDSTSSSDRGDEIHGSSSRVVRTVASARLRLTPIIGPLALFGSTILFILVAAQRAWLFGPGAAVASRYLYAYVALSLPLIAASIQSISRWWRPAAVAIPALLILGVPHNIAQFEDTVFSPDHHDHQGRLILNVLRHPAAANAPDRLRPDPDVFNSQSLTVGFLRRAATEGKLPEVSGPIPADIDAELTVRLGLMQELGDWRVVPCQATTVAHLEPTVGMVFFLTEPVLVTPRSSSGQRFPVEVTPDDGAIVTVVAPGLDLDLTSQARPGSPASICVVN